MAITYKDSGVDTEAGDQLIDRIIPLTHKTRIPEVIGSVGGFAGLCSIPSSFKEPILVSGSDGVGTKLEIAFETNIHNTIGIDLVAMCVNDIVTVGARPLFFLDYFASSHLDIDVAESVISGIANGCREAGCALIGGETAELPGMYRPNTYDLAGFAVGVVEKSEIIDGSKVKAGDTVIGIASSGLHSNGFSLARKVINNVGKASKEFLTPTRIYVKLIQELLKSAVEIRAISHITGGGIPGNLPRVLPDELGTVIDLTTFTRPDVFNWLAENGPIEENEMRRTFNIGVGMCIVVPRNHVDSALKVIEQAGESGWILGDIVLLGKVPFEGRVIFV